MVGANDKQDYIKQLITVFDQAEDLESLEDLHALCSLMQTIREPTCYLLELTSRSHVQRQYDTRIYPPGQHLHGCDWDIRM